MDIRQRLLAAFEFEHKDHLSAIRTALRVAEETGAPPDIVDIHRRAHSLKGAARAVDLPEVEAIAHRMEAAFIAVQRGAAALDPETVAVVRRALDAIEDVVAWSTRGGSGDDGSGGAAGEGGAVELSGILADLDRIAAVRTQPPTGAGAPAPQPPAVAAAEPPAREPRRPAPAAGAAPSLVRIAAQGLEQLSVTAGALLPEVEAQAALGEEMRALRQEWRALERAWRHMRPRMQGAAEGDAMRSATAAFERRLRALGAALDHTHRGHDRLVWSMRRWGGGLQEDVRRLRMLPAESQFGGLGRMIRDISRSQGKEVEVDVRGLEVEADRGVLQRLKDPVLHIARNAISHGIEPPEERILRGKRPAARIAVTAAVEGGRLRLTIEDDGRGIDGAAIARHAVDEGLLAPEAAAEATPEQLVELLFRPGFSTAERTTELAGRGMGLAIARAEVERLQGTLTIAGRGDGPGSVVTIEVPLSLLSQRLLFVGIEDEVMAVPSADVVRLHRIPAEDLFSGLGTPTIRLEDEDVPVTSLAALLGMEAAAPAAVAGRRLSLLVARVPGGRRLALAVDRFVATREAVVTAADEVGLDPARYLGTVLLDDGSPALVLNILRLLPAPGDGLPAAVRHSREMPRPVSHILVVDDSITTRTLEKSILEAHGYRVSLCVDGREALERLTEAQSGEGPGVDLIISDVEMPRMDGFALLQAVKADPRLSEVPVILVTSRASDEDRERGLRLGADAYIVKTRFDQNELLAGIRRLL